MGHSEQDARDLCNLGRLQTRLQLAATYGPLRLKRRNSALPKTFGV